MWEINYKNYKKLKDFNESEVEKRFPEFAKLIHKR
jgi:hypothetical protein